MIKLLEITVGTLWKIVDRKCEKSVGNVREKSVGNICGKSEVKKTLNVCGNWLLENVGNVWENFCEKVVGKKSTLCGKVSGKIFTHKGFTHGMIPCEIRGKGPLPTGFPTDFTVGKSSLCSSV